MYRQWNIPYHLLLIGIIALLLASCQQDAPTQEAVEGNATLSLRLGVPKVSAEVRSVSSAPTSPDTWTAWERAVDGRYLYRVTAFLLQGNRLVACKDLSLTEEPAETQMKFDGNFTHGTYQLLVVANYSEHSADDGDKGTQYYEGLTDFTATVSNILTQGAIDNFTTTYADNFLNYKLSAGDDAICPQTPQALSLAKTIELHPGTNEVEGELIRTYARIRITVENHSDEKLQVNSLSFSNLFAQKQAYLFTDKGYLSDTRSTLDVPHPDCLTPFTATSDNPMTIEGKGNAVIFDAYILESEKADTEADYSYTLGVGYDTGAFKYVVASGTTAITRRDNLATGTKYLIYCTSGGYNPTTRYLGVQNATTVITTTENLSSADEIDGAYIWELEQYGSNQYYIKNTTSECYMADPTESNVTVGSINYVYFKFTNNNNGGIKIQSSKEHGNRNKYSYYLYVNNGNVYGDRNNGTAFYFYPLTATGGAISQKADIPLKTIDNASGQAVLVDEIKRNDYIDVAVSVSYNKNKGHFTFEVKDWETGGGNVSFN